MSASVLFCDNCGAVNDSNDTYCNHCKLSLQTRVSANPAGVSKRGTGRLAPQIILKRRYRVLTTIGRGGMGAVYVAEDMHLGNRRVAIKEMSQTQLGPTEVQGAVRDFQQEAHLLAGLSHPNLPSIHDHFEEHGRWYLVMSYIDGETLEDYLNSHPGKKLPLYEVLQIGIILCKVLAYLHTHRPPIIFRDLKLANIMRTREGHIYLIDFGIARFFKPGQIRDTAPHGSAGYAPPEQYGRAQTTTRSDIYSLGATLLHMLTGYHPSNAPFRLPRLRSLEPTMPHELDDLIARMLKLDDNERPATVTVVEQALNYLMQLSSGRILQPNPLPTIPQVQPAPLSKERWLTSDREHVQGRGQIQQRSFASKESIPVHKSSEEIWLSSWRHFIMIFIVGAVICAMGWDFSAWWIDVSANTSFGVLITTVFFFLAARYGPLLGLLIGSIGYFLASAPFLLTPGSFSFIAVLIGLQGLFIGWLFLKAGRSKALRTYVVGMLFVVGIDVVIYIFLGTSLERFAVYALIDLISLTLATLLWKVTKK